MVLVKVISINGNEKKAKFCCEVCARRYCTTKKWVAWWEVVDPQLGCVIDSSELYEEEREYKRAFYRRNVLAIARTERDCFAVGIPTFHIGN